MQALSAVLKFPNTDFKSWSAGAQEKGRLQGSAPELSPRAQPLLARLE